MTTMHATCVALDQGAVLLTGRPGAGKSDLALRLIDEGAVLVADDRTALAAEPAGLTASAPAALAGLLEVRGLGIVRLPARESARVRLVAALDGAAAAERLPPVEEREEILAVSLPLVRLSAFEASAPARIRLALRIAAGAGERVA